MQIYCNRSKYIFHNINLKFLLYFHLYFVSTFTSIRRILHVTFHYYQHLYKLAIIETIFAQIMSSSKMCFYTLFIIILGFDCQVISEFIFCMTRFTIWVTKLWQKIKIHHFLRNCLIYIYHHFSLSKFNEEPKNTHKKMQMFEYFISYTHFYDHVYIC